MTTTDYTLMYRAAVNAVSMPRSVAESSAAANSIVESMMTCPPEDKNYDGSGLVYYQLPAEALDVTADETFFYGNDDGLKLAVNYKAFRSKSAIFSSQGAIVQLVAETRASVIRYLASQSIGEATVAPSRALDPAAE
jgi:hypothetical protein